MAVLRFRCPFAVRARHGFFAVALLATLCALAPAAATAAAGPGAEIDALLLGEARSPVLDELRDVSDLDATRAAEVDGLEPRRYDVLVVDADRLSSDDLGDVGMIEDFVAAGGFTMVLDAEPRDHAAIADYTAFDLSAGAGGERSAMVMFGLSDAGGSEEMLIVNSGDLRPEDAAGAPDAEVRALRALAARRAAIAARRQIVADRNDDADRRRRRPGDPAASRGDDAMQHRQQGALRPLRPIHELPRRQHAEVLGGAAERLLVPARLPAWNSRWPKPLTQEASWQADHFFDVYLDKTAAPRATTR